MNTSSDYRGPLNGIKVIDFGHYYAGPLAAMLLAEQGAEVIRVKQPGATDLPHEQYALFNRNKKIVELDVKTDEGKQQALELISHADVVIENFRPGVMKRLGLDYASIKSTNPSVVYLSLPGFASTDQERANIQAWEGVVAAAAGVFTETSVIRQKLNFPPVFTSIPQCSMYGGIHGAISVVAALNAREEHMSGTQIEVPLVDAGMSGFSGNFIMGGGPLRSLADRDAPIPDFLKASEYLPDDSEGQQLQKLDQAANAMMDMFGPLGRLYRCADGRQLIVWSPPGSFTESTESFLRALGIYDTLLSEGFVNEGSWKTDLTNNLSGVLSPERKKRVTALVEEVMLTKTAEEWESALENADTTGSMLRTRQEWMSLTPLRKSGLFTELTVGGKTLVVPGRIADMSGPDGEILNVKSEAPKKRSFSDLKQELAGRKVQAEKTFSSKTLKKSDLLKGLKVLDLSNVVAGPMSSYTLSQYGAEVIKADPPNKDAHHNYLMTIMLESNQSKRSILTNVKTEPGRKILNDLIAWADVVIHNRMDKDAIRLGVSHEQLKAINPKVVSCQLSAYGGTWRGGWEMRPGFDVVLQCASGLLAHFGSLESPQWHGSTSAGDILGGLGLAFSALLGVYQQRTTGYGGEGRTSLARMINYAQLPWMMADEQGKCDWGEARGQMTQGIPSDEEGTPQYWQRIYPTQNGWVYVGTAYERREALAEFISGDACRHPAQLEPYFLKQNSEDWVSRLNERGFGCHMTLTANDICDKHTRKVTNDVSEETATGSCEIFQWDDHPCGIPIIFMAPNWVRVGEDHSYLRLSPAPRLGEHTREILAELGYSEKQIEELIKLKISHEFVPVLGSKAAYLTPVEEA